MHPTITNPPPTAANDTSAPNTGSHAIVSYRPQELAEPPTHLEVDGQSRLRIECWDGPLQGPQLRRAARLADRVCVVVSAGQSSSIEVAKTGSRLGRQNGIGYLLVNLDAPYADLLDRIGRVDEFWASSRE